MVMLTVLVHLHLNSLGRIFQPSPHMHGDPPPSVRDEFSLPFLLHTFPALPEHSLRCTTWDAIMDYVVPQPHECTHTKCILTCVRKPGCCSIWDKGVFPSDMNKTSAFLPVPSCLLSVREAGCGDRRDMNLWWTGDAVSCMKPALTPTSDQTQERSFHAVSLHSCDIPGMYTWNHTSVPGVQLCPMDWGQDQFSTEHDILSEGCSQEQQI